MCIYETLAAHFLGEVSFLLLILLLFILLLL